LDLLANDVKVNALVEKINIWLKFLEGCNELFFSDTELQTTHF